MCLNLTQKKGNDIWYLVEDELFLFGKDRKPCEKDVKNLDLDMANIPGHTVACHTL